MPMPLSLAVSDGGRHATSGSAVRTTDAAHPRSTAQSARPLAQRTGPIVADLGLAEVEETRWREEEEVDSWMRMRSVAGRECGSELQRGEWQRTSGRRSREDRWCRSAGLAGGKRGAISTTSVCVDCSEGPLGFHCDGTRSAPCFRVVWPRIELTRRVPFSSKSRRNPPTGLNRHALLCRFLVASSRPFASEAQEVHATLLRMRWPAAVCI